MDGMKKERFVIICKCGMKVAGFSPLHAERNLTIHQKTSFRHKERMELITKGVPDISCNIPCNKCKKKGEIVKLKPLATGGECDPVELKCPKCNYLGGKIEQISS